MPNDAFLSVMLSVQAFLNVMLSVAFLVAMPSLAVVIAVLIVVMLC
jgi:hypothetical protein